MIASRAVDSSLEIPIPPGLEYLPYQKAGIEYSLGREGTLIADEMGLGKTIQAIGVCNAVSASSILVICPASLKLNWRKEMQKFLVRTLHIEVASSKAFPAYANCLIINYEILRKYRTQLRSVEWDVLIVDESHLIKNSTSKRTKEIIGHYANTNRNDKIEPLTAKKKIFLTGTPILNRPVELWTSLAYLNPEYWVGDGTAADAQWAFWVRYCGYKRGFRNSINVSGARNLSELQRRLRESVMIRRLKKDVLKDLPPKVRQVIEIEPDTHARATIQEEQIEMEQIRTELRDIKEAIASAERTGDMNEYQEQVKLLRQGATAGLAKISRLRKLTALAKVPMMIKYLEDLLEGDQKVIVFAHHKEVMDKLSEAFPNSVSVRGGMSIDDKESAVTAFQNGKANPFIGSIKAAGVGLTLTAANMVVFAELDWVPANMTQCEDRAHRIGQQDSVLCQHFVLEGSLDANMANKIVEKQNICDQALDNPIATLPVLPD